MLSMQDSLDGKARRLASNTFDLADSTKQSQRFINLNIILKKLIKNKPS